MADDRRVGDVGEGELVRAITAAFSPAARALVGPGDDAAVLEASARIVATTDTLVHGPDFRLAWSSGHDLGWKAAAVNLADVAAMGATPTALLVALAVPSSAPLALVVEIARGLQAAVDALAPGCGIVGGDVTVSETLTIAVTALGDLRDASTGAAVDPVLRAGARAGDDIAVAGALGDAAAGLALLFDRFVDGRGEPVAVRADELDARDAERLAAQLRPAPPLWAGPVAARAGAHAMMDVSDGLALDAARMAEASGVSIALEGAALGADPRARRLALVGGEDHALLAAFAPGTAPEPFRVIGRVVAAVAGAPVLVDGAPPQGPGGWDPHRDWDARRG